MVKDAEAHASEDKRFHELVEARNIADNLIHSATKSLKDLGDKVETNDKTAIEAAVDDLKEAVNGDDKAEIEAKTQTLAELSGKMAQQAYGQADGVPPGAEGFTEAAAQAAAAGAQQNKPKDKPADDVVDAEFEEVKDKK